VFLTLFILGVNAFKIYVGDRPTAWNGLLQMSIGGWCCLQCTPPNFCI